MVDEAARTKALENLADQFKQFVTAIQDTDFCKPFTKRQFIAETAGKIAANLVTSQKTFDAATINVIAEEAVLIAEGIWNKTREMGQS